MGLFQIKAPGNAAVGSGAITATIEWSPGFAQDREARFARAQKMFDQEVLRLTEPYVPFQTGMLALSPAQASDIGSGLLVWSTPYAAAQYYNTALTRPYDARRGGLWFERMCADNKAHLIKFAERAVNG